MSFSKRISKNRFVYMGSAFFFLVLTLIVLIFPIEFSEYRNSDRLAPIWYLITETGNMYAAVAVILTIFIYLRIHYKDQAQKFKSIYLFVGMIILLQILITTVSQIYAKDFLAHQRPSQLYLEEKGFIENGGNEFFTMPGAERQQYLQKKMEENKDSVSHIFPPILNSWIAESGYSFPSGHSQTTFFLGTIIAFIIFKKSVNKFNCLIPILWGTLVSISRVVIGIHYPVDVIAGAGLGLLAGFILISLNRVDEIFRT